MRLRTATLLFLISGVMAGLVHAQDLIIQNNGNQIPGQIMKVDPDGVTIRRSDTPQPVTLKFYNKDIKVVQIKLKENYPLGVKAFEDGKFQEVIAQLEPTLAPYKGARDPNVSKGMLMLADAHFSLNNIPKAEAAYREFAALYPDDKSAVDVGLAKIAITQKKPDDALKLLVGFETLAPKVASPTAAQERAFSEAFYLLGQVYEQKNDSQKALVSYLKSAAIYSGYENVSAKAQERADMLRKAQNREKEAPALYVP